MTFTHIIKGKNLPLPLLIFLVYLSSGVNGQGCTIECSVTQQQCTVCFQKCQGVYSFANCSQVVETSISQHTSAVVVMN